jgi:hypothetical protein
MFFLTSLKEIKERKKRKAARTLMTRIYYYVYGDNFHKNVYRQKNEAMEQ